MLRRCIMACLFVVMGCLVLSSRAQERAAATAPSKSSTVVTSSWSASSTPSADTPGAATNTGASSAASLESRLRIEGEERFRTNCSRCHMAPHRFPPRVMATAIRHMRVRALLTDEDMRLILRYMTE